MTSATEWVRRGACGVLAGAMGGCGTGLVGYCAPGSPECTVADAASAVDASPFDAFVATGDAAEETGDGASALGDAGPDGNPDGGEASGCDPSQAPSQEPCVVADAYGVFVSPSGSPTAAGTRADPVSTIGRGLDLAKSAGKSVFVCAGTYAEKIVLGASRDGAKVYGGLDCATWSYAATNHATVAPAATGYALELDGLVAGATFEDIEFDAQNASSTPGESSVAAFVNGSQSVVLTRVVLVAGAVTATAAAGVAGGTSGDPSNAYVSSLDGLNAGDAGAPPAKTCTCPDGTSSLGGQGGSAGQSPGAGGPSYGVSGGGAAGTNMASSCGNGGTPVANGADAPAGIADAPAASLGALSASGWSSATGATASNGKPGQGGGGGGDGKPGTGAGGGGACGGCGGAGGKPGAAGGASIAVLVFHSSVSLNNCTLTAKAAGNGGHGGSGEMGQPGGSPGAPFGSGPSTACAGGVGGAGAGGNGGQGGPGGVSVGLLFSGTAPIVNGAAVTSSSAPAGITFGTQGTAGAKGLAGPAAGVGLGQPGADGAPGTDGVAQAVLSVP